MLMRYSLACILAISSLSVASAQSTVAPTQTEPAKKQKSKAADTQKQRAAVSQPDRSVVYKQVGERKLLLHVFEPVAQASQPRPAIVFFFGGGWTSGTPEQFYPQSRYLADRGMVALCADYRVHSRDQALVIDCIADAQDAVRYVREHAVDFKIAPARIAAGGGSAGGHLAAAVATLNYRGQPSVAPELFRPAALVLFNPALVLAPIAGTALKSQDAVRVERLEERMGDKPEAVSPYHHLTESLPPTLILHGQADTTVPYATVVAFRDRAEQLKVDCKLVGYPDQTHGFFNYARGQAGYTATRDEMGRFFERLGWLAKP